MTADRALIAKPTRVRDSEADGRYVDFAKTDDALTGADPEHRRRVRA
jgi:hypothetical protein